MPASNRSWWEEKFARNVQRDREKAGQLRDSGWRVMIVWECAVRTGGITRDDSLERLVEWIVGGAAIGIIPDDSSRLETS